METIRFDNLFEPSLLKKVKDYYEAMLELRSRFYFIHDEDEVFYDKLSVLANQKITLDNGRDVLSDKLREESSPLKLAYIMYVLSECGAFEDSGTHEYPHYSMSVLGELFAKDLPLEETHCLFLLKQTAALIEVHRRNYFHKELVNVLEPCVKKLDMTESLYSALTNYYMSLFLLNETSARRARIKVNQMLGDRSLIPLSVGEAWSDCAITDISSMSEDLRKAWVRLIEHCEDATGGQPSEKWFALVRDDLDQIGHQHFQDTVIQWFRLVDKPRTDVIETWPEWVADPNLLINDNNASVIKGLVWCCSLFEGKDIARSLRDLAVSAYRKVAGVGSRAVKIGNACIYSLGHMPGMDGLYQLGYLNVKVRFKTALKLIDKSLQETAERLNVTPSDLEEMSVPSCGLTDAGILIEPMGDFQAQLIVLDSGKTELTWIKPDGKVQKSVPASVKEEFAEELKDIKAGANDIQKLLPAQKERIQNLYLQKKVWDYPVWKERYLDHPLVAIAARRLIWTFKDGQSETDAIFHQGHFIDLEGHVIDETFSDYTSVQLWHPIGHAVDYIKRWRDKLAELQIKQPFKQAHREVYLLTDAERQTRLYSNRYAAHIVKQHQFNALCGVRRWSNSLKLMVDNEFPPASLSLPQWNLRAEFWTDGIGEEYGGDTNETGTYYYLSTDQVRFFEYETPQTMAHGFGGGREQAADPVPLEDIPAFVFSEVMRDIDLFVGVSSVGNDPAWVDAGPEGHRNYWYHYSFGELSPQAQTRRDVLSDLISRLAIADQCSFEDRFLKVQGRIRTYKIHLGSSNILMEPNDAYLCIVANRTKEMKDGTSNLFLPFEGDETLSVIISKAILLANDDKIKDSTIVSQIKKF